jgi:isoleucyl-tRNA synthetase
VQNARKSAGLEVEDRIELRLGGDDELLAAASEHAAYIRGETLAESLDFGTDGGNGPAAVIEGRELRIDLARA